MGVCQSSKQKKKENNKPKTQLKQEESITEGFTYDSQIFNELKDEENVNQKLNNKIFQVQHQYKYLRSNQKSNILIQKDLIIKQENSLYIKFQKQMKKFEKYYNELKIDSTIENIQSLRQILNQMQKQVNDKYKECQSQMDK